MGKTKGSSSKRPHIEEDIQEEEDLTQTYKAPFPIHTHEEGSSYTTIKFREIISCKYIPTPLLNDVGMLDSFDQMMTQCGLKKFVSMHEDTYIDLLTEFYTTLDNSTNSQVLEFRLLGKQHQLTYSSMQRVFGFKKGGLCDPPPNFNVNEFWTLMTDLQTPFQPKKGKTMFIKDLKYWLLHKVLACVIFNKTEFNKVSSQELFLMWCVHNKKQVSWTYWLFNQLLACATKKDALLTHGHVVTIIAKSLNVDLTNLARTVKCSFFTKQAFVRGEMLDSSLKLIPAHTRSCWRGHAPPQSVEKSSSEDGAELNLEEPPIAPHYTPFSGDVPLLTYPIQSAPGSSSDYPPIWDQILQNQVAMQNQLNEMAFYQKQQARRQRKMEYKMAQYFAKSGYNIESPPSTPTDD